MIISKNRVEVPGPAKYNLDVASPKDKSKGISLASAPRKVDKVWILNTDIPGPKYEVRGNMLKPVSKIRRKKAMTRMKEEERCVLVDKSKVVPDPGIYNVILPISEEGRGASLTHKPSTLKAEQLRM